MAWPTKYTDDRDRVTLNVRVDDNGCWVWQLHIRNSGYGLVRLPRPARTVQAHRFSYETFVGPIPEGLALDHLCRNPPCVNPEHLEPVTQQENLLRSPLTFQGRNARKTECPSSHPYDDTNTRLSKGKRYCRACDRDRRAARALAAANIRSAA